MAVPIAELFISVSADVNGAISGLNALGNKLNSTTNAFNQARPAALALTGAAVGIGAAFAGSVQVAATFERAMSGVKAVMTPGDVQKFGGALEDLAVALGAKTSFNAMQTASAIEELIKQGIPAEAVLGGAADAVLALAAATGSAPAEAATVAAQAMNAFKVSVADLPTVVDRLAGVTNVTAADMGGLRLALQQVGAVSHLAGFSFEDTAVAIGAMANAGVVGSDAGTSLKTMFLNLVPSTKQQTAAFQKLGIITADGANQFFDATGKVKNMASVAGVLETAFAGMSHEQKLATAQTLFGTDAMRAAAILAELGAKGFNDLSAQVQKVSAADQAAERLNNLLGAMEQLGGAIQSLQIKIGKLFLPELRNISGAIQGVVQSFLSLTPEQQRTAAFFVAIAGAVAGTIGGIVLLAPAVAAMGPAFSAVGRVLLSLVPAFRVVALVAGVLAAAWATNLFGIQEKVQAAFDAIPGILDAVSGAFAAAGSFWETAIMPAISTIANAIEQRVIPVFNDLSSRVGPLLSHFGILIRKAFSGDVGGAINSFITIIGTLIPGLGPILTGVRDTITGAFDQFGPVFGNIALVAQKVFQGDLGGAFDTFRAIVGTVSGPLGGLLGIFQEIGGFVRDTIIPKMGELAGNILPTLGQLGGALGQALETQLSPALQNVGGFLASILPFFAKLGNSALPILQTASESLATFWDTKMQPAFQKVGDFIDANLLKSLADLGTGLSNLTVDKVAVTADAFGGAFLQSLTAFGTQLQPLLPVFQSVGNLVGSIANVFSAFSDLRARGQGAAEDPLTSSLQRLADFVVANQGLGATFLELLGPFGAPLQALTANGASTAAFFNNVADALNKFADAIRNMPDLPPWLQQFIAGNVVGAAQAAGTQLGNDLRTEHGLAPVSFTPGGSGGGPLINIGQLIISSEAEAQAFLAQMAAAVRGSAGRVNTPPDNSGNPQLERSFA